MNTPQDHKKPASAELADKFEQIEVDVPVMNEDGTPAKDDGGKPVTEKLSARRGVVRGIEVTVLDEALNDFEILDDIRAVQDQNDASRVPALLRRLLGKDQYEAVLNKLRGPRGRVTVEAGAGFVFELIQAINPN